MLSSLLLTLSYNAAELIPSFCMIWIIYDMYRELRLKCLQITVIYDLSRN